MPARWPKVPARWPQVPAGWPQVPGKRPPRVRACPEALLSPPVPPARRRATVRLPGSGRRAPGSSRCSPGNGLVRGDQRCVPVHQRFLAAGRRRAPARATVRTGAGNGAHRRADGGQPVRHFPALARRLRAPAPALPGACPALPGTRAAVSATCPAFSGTCVALSATCPASWGTPVALAASCPASWGTPVALPPLAQHFRAPARRFQPPTRRLRAPAWRLQPLARRFRARRSAPPCSTAARPAKRNLTLRTRAGRPGHRVRGILEACLSQQSSGPSPPSPSCWRSERRSASTRSSAASWCARPCRPDRTGSGSRRWPRRSAVPTADGPGDERPGPAPALPEIEARERGLLDECAELLRRLRSPVRHA
jgi:hypothetical protein